MSHHHQRIKCEGRFSELRGFLYHEIIPAVLNDRTVITQRDIDDIWTLSEDELQGFDRKDPYYFNEKDQIRQKPEWNSLSLVPLIESQYHPEKDIVVNYLRSQTVPFTTSHILCEMTQMPARFLQTHLHREPRTILFPGGSNLSGYHISANFGIGSISSGGVGGGGIRSDSPYLLEVYKQSRQTANLVGVIGFWAKIDKC